MTLHAPATLAHRLRAGARRALHGGWALACLACLTTGTAAQVPSEPLQPLRYVVPTNQGMPLLALQGTPRPDCYGWTVLTTVQPCLQCAGAIAMSGLRGVAYAAADPWAGCTHLLTDAPYVSRKRIRVERAPADVQRAALRLMLHALLDDLQAGGNRNVLDSFDAAHPQDVIFTEALHTAGTLAALRDQRAPLADALEVLA